MPTVTSLQSFLAFLQGSPQRLGLGLVRQCGDLGGQGLGRGSLMFIAKAHA
jgi:hypothetical protein